MLIHPNKIKSTENNEVNCDFNCPFCDNVSKVTVTQKEYHNRFHRQMSIQSAMPNQNSAVREVFTSAMCEECQKEFFLK